MSELILVGLKTFFHGLNKVFSASKVLHKLALSVQA